MAEALYRKYRPVKLSDVYGQEIVVKTLKKSFENDKVAHAYLFSGPRGIGKTSLAKIIAKTINCDKYPIDEACGECPKCKLNVNNNSDIIEIDAASNNGVDEIRELRNNVKFMPSILKYKVYIIDEVHMLSTGAFNALLKTLEEPPRHAIFILATTELHKIPETIISRCQCFNLNKLSQKAIIDRLNVIIDNENIKCEDKVIENVARLSNGGMRDAINMLEQLSSFSDDIIKLEDVFLLNGIVDPLSIATLVKFVFDKNIVGINNNIKNFKIGGKDIYKLSEELLMFVKDLLFLKLSDGENEYFNKDDVFNIDEDAIIKLLNLLNESISKIRFSLHPEIFLEALLLEAVVTRKGVNQALTVDKKDIHQNNIKIKAEKEKKVIIKDLLEKKEDLSKKEEINDKVQKSNLRKNCEYQIKDLDEFEEFKNNRVNNIFSSASKNILKDFLKKIKEVEEYLVNKKVSHIATLILDGKIRVASDWGIIFSYKYDSMVDRFNCLLIETEKFLNKIFGKEICLIAITDSEWESCKNEYINTKDKASTYFFVNEDFDINELFIVNNKTSDTPLIEETLEKIDEDLIEIK